MFSILGVDSAILGVDSALFAYSYQYIYIVFIFTLYHTTSCTHVYFILIVLKVCGNSNCFINIQECNLLPTTCHFARFEQWRALSFLSWWTIFQHHVASIRHSVAFDISLVSSFDISPLVGLVSEIPEVNIAIHECRDMSGSDTQLLCRLPLVSLDLAECADVVTDEILASFSALSKQLHTLILTNCPLITSAGAVQLGQMSHLTRLQLDSCLEVDDVSLSGLVSLPLTS